MHVMPGGIDFGVMDITAARGHGSFSRSTRVVWLSSSMLKSDRRSVHFGGIYAQSPALVWWPRAAIVSIRRERTRCGDPLVAELL